MNHATASIDRITALLKVSEIDPACSGPGQCHGCLVWCNTCGDVGDTCHDKACCDTHRPQDCCGRTQRDCELERCGL